MNTTVKSLKTQLVNFRVDEHEFQSLQEAWKTSGERSFSGFVRARVLARVHERVDFDETLSVRLSLVEEHVEEIDAKLETVCAAFGLAEPASRGLGPRDVAALQASIDLGS
jgi:hypothetical protein